MSLKYVIIDADEVSGINFTEVLETNSNTLRWNQDESKTVVKFRGATPSFLEGKTQYDHAAILTEMGKAEWNPLPE